MQILLLFTELEPNEAPEQQRQLTLDDFGGKLRPITSAVVQVACKLIQAFKAEGVLEVEVSMDAMKHECARRGLTAVLNERALQHDAARAAG